jgi:protein TonB
MAFSRFCRVQATGAIGALLVTACSAPTAEKPVDQVASAPAPAAKSQAPLVSPLTMDGYKKAFAQKVAASSGHLFDEPLPEMLKSVVVLDVTIDREGNLMRVIVRRSNGFKALENRALDAVRHAAPYEPPAFTLRRSDGSVNFLETFLFRDDGRYRIRSLIAEK